METGRETTQALQLALEHGHLAMLARRLVDNAEQHVDQQVDEVRNVMLVRFFTYDQVGNRRSVSSFATGGVTDVGTGQTVTYNRANRLQTTSAGSGPRRREAHGGLERQHIT